jgi:8-oxo-dGTP diphosphatase
MQTLLTLHESDILPNTVDQNPILFSYREAARAIVVDEKGRIALLKVGKNNYHKLPGGGLEVGEDKQEALQRELMEEIGCKAEIVAEVGQTVEFRDIRELKQTSYCYIAKIVGKQQSSTFTENELCQDFEMKWANDIDTAIALLRDDKPINYEGKFIQKRDLKLLEAAKPLLQLR